MNDVNIKLDKLKKINLEKKYTYLPIINKYDQRRKNIFDMIKQMDKKGLLEEVGIEDLYLSEKKKSLYNTRLLILKKYILNNKPIPDRWIVREDYNSLLKDAMSDPLVLNYAILNKDLYKRRSYADINTNINDIDINDNNQEITNYGYSNTETSNYNNSCINRPFKFKKPRASNFTSHYKGYSNFCNKIKNQVKNIKKEGISYTGRRNENEVISQNKKNVCKSSDLSKHNNISLSKIENKGGNKFEGIGTRKSFLMTEIEESNIENDLVLPEIPL